MTRVVVFVGAMMLLMTPAMLGGSHLSLRVHTDTGRLVWCTTIVPGDTVQLQFTHSMFGGYVHEHWQVTSSRQFQRVRFVTENPAAAEYYATDGTSYRADDGYEVPGDPLVQSELVIRVNTRGNHVLDAGGGTVHLADTLQESTQVRLSIVPTSCEIQNQSMSRKGPANDVRFIGTEWQNI